LIKLLAAPRGAADLARLTFLLHDGVSAKVPAKAKLQALRDRALLIEQMLSSMLRDVFVRRIVGSGPALRNADFAAKLDEIATGPDFDFAAEFPDRLARCRDQILGNVDPVAALAGLLTPAAKRTTELGVLTIP
jgi:hypothetical protein